MKKLKNLIKNSINPERVFLGFCYTVTLIGYLACASQVPLVCCSIVVFMVFFAILFVPFVELYFKIKLKHEIELAEYFGENDRDEGVEANHCGGETPCDVPACAKSLKATVSMEKPLVVKIPAEAVESAAEEDTAQATDKQ